MKHISPWTALQDYKYVVCNKESPINDCELFKRKDIAITVCEFLNEHYNDAYEVREIMSIEEFTEHLNNFLTKRTLYSK